MKSILYIAILYISLSVVVISCSEGLPEPARVQAAVVGADCQSGWYILKLLDKNDAARPSGSYVGQLQSGYVTTNNLPEEYRQPGQRLQLSLELNGKYSPLCTSVHTVYPAVRIKRVYSKKIAA